MDPSAHDNELHQEPQHPGWKSLGEVLKEEHRLFDKTLFLEGFQFSSNIYVLQNGYLTVIDPGNDYTAYMDLFALELEPGAIKKIVATHGHHDHVMGAFELLRSYPSISESGGYELLIHEAGPQELKEMVKGFGCRVTEVRGGETLELSGFEWEVIHTPGHTIDGICLYHAPTRTLLSGDVVMPHAIGAPDPKAAGKLDHYLFSLRSLLKKEVENVLPGHGGPVAGEGRRIVEETYEGLIMKELGVESEDKVQWFEGASRLAQKGLLEESVFCCIRELATNPGNLNALQLKALCLNDMGRCGEAIEAFDKILSKQADSVYALIGKGCGMLGLGRFDEALSCLEEALSLDPTRKDARVYKGMALYFSGRTQEAMDIEEFAREFTLRFKEELKRKRGSSSSQDS